MITAFHNCQGTDTIAGRLRDKDDDVRSAAAATLAPIADLIVGNLPVELQEIVTVIWDCLGDLKDDLSSSVGAVMDLLGEREARLLIATGR